MNFLFVILHYLTLNDTLEAVLSIKKWEPESRIVIVDNASDNGSIERLRELFYDDKLIDIIVSTENLGFAKGNNLGISYAMEKYSSDFICLMNNDVILIESITKMIQNEYESSHFSVLGPMIYTADGRCDDNPGVNTPMSMMKLNSLIKSLKRMILINKMHLGLFIDYICKIVRGGGIARKNYLERVEDVQLHGCFWVFSPEFFSVFDGLYPETFLNMEEDILFWQVQKANLKTVYNPAIHVFHKEDCASKELWPSESRRAVVKLQNMLDSAYAFARLMSK